MRDGEDVRVGVASSVGLGNEAVDDTVSSPVALSVGIGVCVAVPSAVEEAVLVGDADGETLSDPVTTSLESDTELESTCERERVIEACSRVADEEAEDALDCVMDAVASADFVALASAVNDADRSFVGLSV